MRRLGLAVLLAGNVALSACVQTKQYADMQFTPPQGDYKLLVLRPDVTVGSLTTGGMVEPRADWTDQARSSIVAALRAQQGSRGGKVTIVEHRNEIPGVGVQELDDHVAGDSGAAAGGTRAARTASPSDTPRAVYES